MVRKSKFTKAQYEIVKNYSRQLNMANGDYVKELYTKDIKILKPIYESLGFKLSSTTCGGCILQMLRTLSAELKLYQSQQKKK